MHKNIGLRIIHEKINRSNKGPTSPIYNNNYNECSLKQNFFDPSKSSPPNEFMLKLQLRMSTYSKLCKNEEMRNSE